MNIQPVGGRVVIRLETKPERTVSGIIIPDTSGEQPDRGEVVAVGPGRVLKDGTRVAPEVKPGDVVLFTKYAGTTVKEGDTEYRVVSEQDILAVLARE